MALPKYEDPARCPSPDCDAPPDEGPEFRHLGFGVDYAWVVCGCGMRGPQGGTNDEAAKLWNNLPRL